MAQSTKRTMTLLVNAKSRKGESFYESVRTELESQSNIQLISSRLVSDEQQIDNATKELVALRPDVFVIGAGDGTISRVIDYLVGTEISMGVLPLGTTNNFARTLGLPLTLKSALQVILRGESRNIDLARIDGDIFANVASIGLSTRIARHVPHIFKKYLGRVAYALTGVYELLRHDAFDCTITTLEKKYTFRTHQLVIANGSFHGGRFISEKAGVHNGRLVVFSMDNGSKVELLTNFIRYNLGGLDALQGQEIVVAPEFNLATVPRRLIEVDGEAHHRSPVRFVCLPRAVRVIMSEA